MRGDFPDGSSPSLNRPSRRLRRENLRLTRARHRGNTRGLVRTGDGHDSSRLFGFVSAHQATYPIRALRRVLGGSERGYHA